MTKVLPILLLCSSLSATAGNLDHLEFLGFSKDGNWLAYETYGIADGSGFPYAEIRIVDVLKNTFSDDTFHEQRKEAADSQAGIDKGLQLIRDQVRRRARKRIGPLGLPSTPPAPLVHHPLTDVGVDPRNVTFSLDNDSGITSEKLVLELKEIPTSVGECAGQDTPKPAAYFELTLFDPIAKSVKELQKDTKLPPQRGCTYDYRIQDVYFNPLNSTIAVFLNGLRPGFEGPDHYYLVVTGKSH
jgi:predicted secreted protein